MSSAHLFAALLFVLGLLQALALWILNGLRDETREVRKELTILKEMYLGHLGEHVAWTRDSLRLSTDLERLKIKYVETLEALARGGSRRSDKEIG